MAWKQREKELTPQSIVKNRYFFIQQKIRDHVWNINKKIFFFFFLEILFCVIIIKVYNNKISKEIIHLQIFLI